MGPAEPQVQKPERIEQRVGLLPEGTDQRCARRLCGAGTVGMSAHAIDRDQHHGTLAGGDRDPVLIVITMADHAQIGVLDLHTRPVGRFIASARLVEPVYSTGNPTAAALRIP